MQDNHLVSTLLASIALPLLALLGGPGHDPEDEPVEEASQIMWLRSLGDREALFQIMDSARNLTEGLEAAEALAELGDVRGLDHLIATLKSPSALLRHQAVQILQWLNHPRGLRALADDPGPLPFSTRGAQREQAYADLNTAATDELVAIWHENDREQWSELELEVIEMILLERLGKLPRPEGGSGPVDRRELDEQVHPQVQRLWQQGDVYKLSRIFRGESGFALRLEAAEALAALGDERALDFLIELLDGSDEADADTAAAMLDWLDLPRGNAALRDRGIEFASDGRSTAEPTEVRPPEAKPRAHAAGAPSDSWAANQPLPNAPAPQTPWRPSAGILFAGAVGGALGFMMFLLGLSLLNMLPPAQTPVGWLLASALPYLLSSVLVGAGIGPLAGRLAEVRAARGQEISEGDPTPMLGALLVGSVSALAAEIALFLLIGL